MKKYICLSCGSRIKKKQMGYCLECGRDSLQENKIRCPNCNKILKENEVDINTIGWNCSNCKIKIYREKQ